MPKFVIENHMTCIKPFKDNIESNNNPRHE